MIQTVKKNLTGGETLRDGCACLGAGDTSLPCKLSLVLLRVWSPLSLVAIGSAKNSFEICLNLSSFHGLYAWYHPRAAAAVSLPSSVLSCCLRPSVQREAGGAFYCCSLSLLCWQRPRVLVYIGRSQHSSRMNLALGTPWRADSDDCTWKLQAGLLLNSLGCSIFNYFF